MKPFKLLDLFSGVGGFSLGLERSGAFETVAFCETDPFCKRVLAKHWPKVKQYDDVRSLSLATLRSDGIEPDAICGGFPCQNISVASAPHGGNLGLDGEQSGLWSEYERLISEVRPTVAIIENVDSLVRAGLDRVLRALAHLGYDAEWCIIPGWIVGAPQARKRCFVVAYPSGQRMEGLLQGISFGATGQGGEGCSPNLFDIAHSAFGGDDRFPQPLLRGMDDRPAHWVDRLHSCGNAVIPAIPEAIGRAIAQAREVRA